MKILIMMVAMALIAGGMFFACDNPPLNFTDVPAIVLSVSGGTTESQRRGGLTTLPRKIAEYSNVRLDNGVTESPSISDIGDCISGQRAVATVRIGRITNWLYGVVYVDCMVIK